jgi:DNA-directed RNA polymerase specialized sigma24 family protein
MPTSPVSPVTEPRPDFDTFYLASRRRLVLEAYALTGDLAAARSAVADAFVAARHHWRKVSRQADPEEWVRPRAWAMAQRRHVGRIWHRERGLSAEQKSIHDALHHLSDQHRKALLLAHLAGFSVEQVARELGVSTSRAEDLLTEAERAFWARTGASGEVKEALEGLAPIAEAAALPRPFQVHRSGARRRRLHAVAGVALLAVVTLLGGMFVVSDDPEAVAQAQDRAAPQGPPSASESMLLDAEQLGVLTPKQHWRQLSTTDNTAGSGINSVCQKTRFADTNGAGTIVRKFATETRPRRNAVQTVEISRSVTAARRAYATTVGWFAGCTEARLQLLSAYRLSGLGEQAQVLKLRIPNKVRRTYVVGVARTGSLTVSTVIETLDGSPPRIRDTVESLSRAVRGVCMSAEAGECPLFTRTAPVLPPLSGETRGTLAVADLPVVGQINRPWVGTEPVSGRNNVAATTCDKTSFVKAGAPNPMTRTFLIPQAELPKRFGITQTYARFGTQQRARALVRQVADRMASCERRDLGAEVSEEVVERRGYRGSQWAMWRLDSEISEDRTVGFWMGVARVGNYVAQVNFTPAGDNDVDADTFQALVTRARDRLFELPRSPR